MEHIIKLDDSDVYRFQSDCGEPGCAIDLAIDKNTPKDRPFMEIYFYATPASFKQRLSWCWRMLRHGLVFGHEFIFRADDIKKFAELLTKVE
jgi:hypothetical protein